MLLWETVFFRSFNFIVQIGGGWMGDRLGQSKTSFNFRYFQIYFPIKESFEIMVKNLLMTLSIVKCYSTGRLYLSHQGPAKALNLASAEGASHHGW